MTPGTSRTWLQPKQECQHGRASGRVKPLQGTSSKLPAPTTSLYPPCAPHARRTLGANTTRPMSLTTHCTPTQNTHTNTHTHPLRHTPTFYTHIHTHKHTHRLFWPAVQGGVEGHQRDYHVGGLNQQPLPGGVLRQQGSCAGGTPCLGRRASVAANTQARPYTPAHGEIGVSILEKPGCRGQGRGGRA